MLIGSGTTLVPLSTIKVNSIEITDVPTFSATLIFIGIIIFSSGLVLYAKGK